MKKKNIVIIFLIALLAYFVVSRGDTLTNVDSNVNDLEIKEPISKTTNVLVNNLGTVESVYSDLEIMNVEYCSDGSEIIRFRYIPKDADWITFYVRYVPKYIDGRYNFLVVL